MADELMTIETLPALSWFGAKISVIGMQFDVETTEQDWTYQGMQIALYERGRAWAIGDWLNFGEARWGERYVQAAELFHLDKQTLMNYKYVSSRFPIERRHPKVSWSQHADLAAMSPEEQDYWLNLSEQNEWTREELRKELKRAKEETVPGTDVVDEDIPFSDESEDSDTGPSDLVRIYNLLEAATRGDAVQTIKSIILQAMDILDVLLEKEGD